MVGGSSLFCQFGVGAAWWPENRCFGAPIGARKARFLRDERHLPLTFQTRFSRDQLPKTKTLLEMGANDEVPQHAISKIKVENPCFFSIHGPPHRKTIRTVSS